MCNCRPNFSAFPIPRSSPPSRSSSFGFAAGAAAAAELERMELETIEIGNLCPEVIESIFSRIPLKPLARLKCVSKTWCNFINIFRLCNPPTSSSGIITLRRRTKGNQELQESTFIKLQDKSQGQRAFNTTHQASVIRQNLQLQLIDSCNGLLLYATNDGDLWTYYVSSPFLDKFLALPPAHEVARLACASLAFDGPSHRTFRVISFFLREFNAFAGTMQCKIFSSETWQWREHEAAVSNSNLLLADGFEPEQCFYPSVLWRSRLYWIWSFCMLLYDIKNEFFKLIPLPLTGQCRKPAPNLLSQLLWESDGRLYFCHALPDGISVFTYIGDQDHLNNDIRIDNGAVWRQWQFNQFVSLKDLTSAKAECIINGTVRRLSVRCRIRPCAFNQDLQLLYLFVPPGRILSYSFETKELIQVWSSHESGSNSSIRKVFPFLFKSVNLFLLSRNMP